MDTTRDLTWKSTQLEVDDVMQCYDSRVTINGSNDPSLRRQHRRRTAI